MVIRSDASDDPSINLAFAGNRDVAVRCLRLLLAHGIRPAAVLSPPLAANSSAARLKALCPDALFLEGRAFRGLDGRAVLASLGLDYIVSVHFPYLFPAEILQLPRVGALNLHPALLPFNRGWHTASWAILDGTPYGATLHWMDTGLDTGDIAFQKSLVVEPNDTAHALYARVLELEVELFAEVIPLLIERKVPRSPQAGRSTFHRRSDLAERQDLRRLGPSDALGVVRVLRALTTNDAREAAYFDAGDTRYAVRVEITEIGRDVDAGGVVPEGGQPGHRDSDG